MKAACRTSIPRKHIYLKSNRGVTSKTEGKEKEVTNPFQTLGTYPPSRGRVAC